MKSVVRRAGLALGGQVGRAALNALLFVLAARALGIDQFGALAGVLAVVALMSPFGSLGAMSIMIRRVTSTGHDVAGEYASASCVAAGLGGVLSLALGVIAAVVASTEVQWWVVALLAASDLVGYRCAEIAGAARQAGGTIFGTAFYPTMVVAGRVVAVVVLTARPQVDLAMWSVGYAAGTLAVTLAIAIHTLHVLGMARPRPRQYLVEWRDGLHFAVGLSAQGAYNDIDKVMLARLVDLAATGAYAAAYRVVDLAFVPMRALLSASYVQFFVAGSGGLAPAVGVARRLLAPGLGVSVLAGVVLMLGADLLPVILGTEYAGAVPLVRLLSVIPVLRAIHYLAADSLTGAGLLADRTRIQVGAAIVNVAANIVMIPMFGVEGAAIASILTGGLLAVALWTVVAVRMHRPVRADTRSQRAGAAARPP